MERKLRNELAKYFEAPQLKRKREFVRQFGMPRISMPYMVLMQARYISKWVWLFSAFVCGLTVYMVVSAQARFVNTVFACLPFMVTLSVTESTRSYRCGMEELEMSARFSLKSIVMARLLMLGTGNLVVLACTIVLLGDLGQVSAAYAMAPFFVTAGGGLFIARKMRGSEGTFLCFGLAALVSGICLYLPWQFQALFTPEYGWVWMLVCVIGIFITGKESYRTVRMAENCVV